MYAIQKAATAFEPEAVVGDGDGRDQAGEDQRRDQVAEVEPLGGEVAGGGAEREGEEDREPVEGFAAGRVDRVDREGSLARVPGCEDERERDAEDDRGRHERDAEVVGQVVGDLRADDADQDDPEPVDPGHVLPRPELEDERDDQQAPVMNVVFVRPRLRLSAR